MGIPEVILTFLISLGFIINLYSAEKIKSVSKGVCALISLVIEIGLLYWGGFYV